jgi:hypothetical protein
VKVVESDGAPAFDLDHPDRNIARVLLMEALGTSDHDFMIGLLEQLTNVGSPSQKVDVNGANFMLSVVNGAKPRDQFEAMLAAKMAAVHMATMTFARRLARVDSIPQQDSAERAFNKLARTFAAQVEALKRYRTGGEQKVTVEHVHVHSGGQAVVGVIEAPGAGDRARSEDQPHARQIAHAPQPPLRSTDTKGDPVPIPRDAERPLPDARRTVTRGAEG